MKRFLVGSFLLPWLPRGSWLARRLRCGLGLHDYFDGYPHAPEHFHEYACDRCGGKFTI